MKIRGVPDGYGGTAWYDAYRLSVVSDGRMQSHLKENYNDPEPEPAEAT